MAFLSGARQRLGRYTPVGHIWRARLFTHLVFPKGQRNQYIAEYYHDTIACYGIETTNLNPEFSPPAEKIKDARLLLKRQRIPGDRPILAIQPFSLWQYKEWGITKYIELINRVTSTFKISVVITGAPNERTRAQDIVDGCRDNIFNLAGVTSIAELPALIKQAKLFLGVDSAGVHIAAAVGTPTISLYGPSPPDIWAPKGKNNIVITSNMPCIPCCNTGCQGRMESQCMEELKVETVAANVCGFLEQLPLQPRPSN
jgi:heptosyltransferase-3